VVREYRLRSSFPFSATKSRTRRAALGRAAACR
jgi:hypothetical protein